MKIEIVKLDNLGRGIGYYNDKIIFVPKSVPGDIVNVEIIKEKKHFYEGRLEDVIKPSKIRLKPICPYFDICGGCDLMHISLSEMLDYKLDKVNELLKKNNISFNVDKIIKSHSQYNYRNKVTLKINDGQIGYYENESHKLVKIDYCYLCKNILNQLIKDINILNINNGEITIRSNYNDEILLSIETSDKVENIDKLVSIYKIVGIVKNDECIYGENYFLDKINDYLFKVSFDSFFQVNPFICSNLFDLIEENTKDSKNVIDLYCGVGTLSIVASKNASNVLGVEINKNAISDASLNKNLNNQSNVEFICADTKNIINKINSNFDTIILDPPRSGVASEVIDKIKEEKINKIIYVSCNPMTLVRDLKLLDMFPNTEHVESFVLLQVK